MYRSGLGRTIQSYPTRRRTGNQYLLKCHRRSFRYDLLSTSSCSRVVRCSDDVVTITANTTRPNCPELSQTKLRSHAAVSLSYWLRFDPVWRERTIQALILPKPSSGGGSNNDTATQSPSPSSISLQQNYRQLYSDSLPSFLEQLRPSFLEQLRTNPPARLVSALNRLVEAGFGDADTGSESSFSHKFRKMKNFQNLNDKAKAEAAEKREKRRELQDRQLQYNRAAEVLKNLEDRYAVLPPLLSNDDTTASSTSFLVELVVDFFKKFSKPDAEERKTAELKELGLKCKRRDLEKKMEKKRRILDAQKKHMKGVHARLAKLELKKASFVAPPLAPDVYTQSNAIVAEVMPDICNLFASHIHNRHSTMVQQYKSLDATTDLTRPYEWFLHARLDKRKIIYHGGPTNSGKTFVALERLKQAKRGMYLGPLRLLAAEVYEKLTAEGVYCNLYTGQERREIPFSTHGAATIEMASLVKEYDCIVIDEIQMIEDKERGFAWTRALLGSRCKEIHVCGGLEAKDIVKRIATACGDDFELKTYERFSQLNVAQKSLSSRSDEIGSYRVVQPGDAIVAFSRNDIFAIKREIEQSTKHKCCVIYGSLPPQTRSEQARLFNDPNSGYDVLVASDSIGMGLNLNIRRVIFNSMFKNDGSGIVRLHHSAVKQIAGRAGRWNVVGEVTTRDPADLPYLQKCMNTEIDVIPRAGLLPTASHIELFSEALGAHGLGHGSRCLHSVLSEFNKMATLKSDFFLCRQTPMGVIARHLAPLNLSIRDKYTLCMCPVIIASRRSMDVLLRFASKLASGQVSGLANSLRPKRPNSFEDMERLCWIYNDLEQFLWLQSKFRLGMNMLEQQAALATKELTVEMIGVGLSVTDKLKLDHCYITRDQRIRAIWKTSQDDTRDDTGCDSEADDWNKGVLDL